MVLFLIKVDVMMGAQIHCPKCYKLVSYLEERSIYLCSPCNLYFEKEDYEMLRKKYLNINTKGISIVENDHHIKMVYRWEKNYFLLFFSLFWSYLSFSFFAASLEQIVENGLGDIFMFVYPLVGIFLLYWTGATCINSTSVVVTQNKIRVFCSPMPWPGMNINYTIKNIEQLYVEKYVSYHQNKKPIYRYKIVLKEKIKSLDLIKGIEKYEVAITLENYMERYLDIQDKPEEEEYKA